MPKTSIHSVRKYPSERQPFTSIGLLAKVLSVVADNSNTNGVKKVELGMAVVNTTERVHRVRWSKRAINESGDGETLHWPG